MAVTRRTAATSILLLLWLLSCASAAETFVTEEPPAPTAITFSPEQLLQVVDETNHIVNWTTIVQGVVSVRISVSDERVATAEVLNGSLWQNEEAESNVTFGGALEVAARFLGFSTVTLQLLDQNEEVLGTGELEVSVILAYQNLATIFSTSIGVLIALVYINMGATIDLQVVKSIAKKPIGPIVGVVCQYGGMPLIAFGLSQLVFKDDPLLQLGMFMSGCCPGGGASNMWTHLLGGRLDLSIMMTFTSTIFAFIAVPSWVLALGPVIAGQADFVIPFGDIAILVVTLVIPCIVGVLIQKFLPRVARFLEMMLTPFSIFNILYIFTFGLYANRYIFEVIDARILLAGLGLPLLGYVIGLVVALLLRLPREDAIAISIETGIQNASIALFILNFTLGRPAGSLAVVVPAASVIMTPIPLMCIYLIKVLYTKIKVWRNGGPIAKTEVSGEASPASEKPAVSTIELPESGPKAGIDNPAADLSDQPA